MSVRPIDDVETPALLVDLDLVERNVTEMQAYCDAHGLALRPHVKTHKLPQLARLQLDAGAVGICCQKLGEAEVMVDAGIDDVLITFPLIGERKAARLAELAGRARLGVAVDSYASGSVLSDALHAAGASVDVLVDCDVGYGRTGVASPSEAAELAARLSSLPGLHVKGLFTYPCPAGTAEWLAEATRGLVDGGTDVETVSVGGTPTARRVHEVPGVTELRVGTYVYGDRSCIASESVARDRCALTVRATVVSRPTPDRALLDAGTKALTSDTLGLEGFGELLEHPEANLYRLDEEHGYVDVSGCVSPPGLGDAVRVIPNHACVVTNMFDEVVVHRSGTIVGTWPVAARGKLI